MSRADPLFFQFLTAFSSQALVVLLNLLDWGSQNEAHQNKLASSPHPRGAFLV